MHTCSNSPLDPCLETPIHSLPCYTHAYPFVLLVLEACQPPHLYFIHPVPFFTVSVTRANTATSAPRWYHVSNNNCQQGSLPYPAFTNLEATITYLPFDQGGYLHTVLRISRCAAMREPLAGRPAAKSASERNACTCPASPPRAPRHPPHRSCCHTAMAIHAGETVS